MIRTKIKYLYPLFVLPVLFSCVAKTKEYSRIDAVLGTVCRVRILDTKPEKEITAVLDTVFEELERLDSIFNANSGKSELETVNENAGIRPVPVSEELYSLLELSMAFAEKTGGAFDPAIGPLAKLWNIGFDNANEPPSGEIQAVLPLLDYRNIVLPDTGTAFLTEKGMRLDLGGIAKGYAADRIRTILKDNGIKNALIDLGGNILAMGQNPSGEAWKIGLKNPNIGHNNSVMRLDVQNKSLVTSGNYERYFEKDGRLFHHILDKTTGYPVKTDINAVSILADSSVYADALSTACYVLGPEKSRPLLDSFKDVSAFFFFNDNSVLVIGGKGVRFELTDQSFFLKE